ncbi:hypothetical protein AABL90_004020 [Salmonella enterica subsp. enterica serovar Newport]
MTTINKERIELFIKNPLENGLTRSEQMELARIALASLEVAPVGEVSEKRHGLVMDGTVDLGGKSTYRIIKGEKAMKRLPLGTKFYIAPPAPVVPEGLRLALSNAGIAAPESDEMLAATCEKYIQMLVTWVKDRKPFQPAPVVPPAIEPDYKVIKSILPTANPDEYACCIAADMWNACRAAMLQGVEQPQNARQNIPENIPDGNSPAIPDDWVMVPKEPTQAMIKAWLSEVANFRGHAAGYKAALAAAPQREVK